MLCEWMECFRLVSLPTRLFSGIGIAGSAMKIYIAGPYTKGDVAVNVATAIHAADHVAALGHTPFIPHLTHFWHMVKPHDYEFWLEQDMQWLMQCDALLRLPGDSSGADKETEAAKKKGLKIYSSLSEIPSA